jgi:hypothetical protein
MVLVTPNSVKRSPFSGYRKYISDLHLLVSGAEQGTDWHKKVFAALNGQPSLELHRVATLNSRRKYGAYFTGSILSERLIAKCSSFSNGHTFYDATCGMGDLLLAAAKRLPLGATLHKTLAQWGEQLVGTDLHAEFIEGAKIRLMLMACQRHQTAETFTNIPEELFPHITVGDGLKEVSAFQHATTLLMNPPFGRVKSPAGCTWASGQVSEAALFMVTALERVRPRTEILAILPEVLRAGAFSRHWRNRVGELAEVHSVEPYGTFDNSADVDVFILRLVRRDEGGRKNLKPWPVPIETSHITVADYFNVRVGRVVPHRDPELGPEYPYIHPRCVPPWIVVREFKEARRYSGLTYQPPFVVIRRTSRPGHPYRATATIIAGKQSVAVENHFIVCKPKDNTLNSCRELVRQLKTNVVNNFLDGRIRCRHLTVGSVGAIPFEPNVVTVRRTS